MSQFARLAGNGQFLCPDGQVIDGEYYVRIGPGVAAGGRFVPHRKEHGARLFNQRGVLVLADSRECAAWFSDSQGTIHLSDSFLPPGTGRARLSKVTQEPARDTSPITFNRRRR